MNHEIAKRTNSTILVNMGSRERSLVYSYVLMNGDMRCAREYASSDLTILVMGEGAKGKITTWYDANEIEVNKKSIEERIKKEPNFYREEKIKFFAYWSELMPYIKKEKTLKNFKELYLLYENYYKGWSVQSFIIDSLHVSEEFKNEYQKWRVENEKYTEEIDKLFINFLLKGHPEYDYIKNVITPEELLSLDAAPFSNEKLLEIETRNNGYALYDFKVYQSKDLASLLERERIILDNEEPDQQHDSLGGVIASKGYVKGKVRVVLYKSDLALVEEGEILVAEATTPDYVQAIRRASAVVTNEGGLMSHAAITCREFKKACIVGTAWATKTFKTGDVVEVDASEIKGVIRLVVGRS